MEGHWSRRFLPRHSDQRLFPRFQGSGTSPHQGMAGLRVCNLSPQETPSRGPGSPTARQECHREDSKQPIPRVLFERLLGAKEERHMAPSNQLKRPEPVPLNPNLQDGVKPDHLGCHQTRRLGNVHRFDRRVLSRTNREVLPQVPPIRHQQRCLSVSGSPFRPLHRPPGLHQTPSTLGNLRPPERSSSASLHRRPSPTTADPPPSVLQYSIPTRRSTSSRLESKRRKVHVDTIPGLHLRWSSLPHPQRRDDSPRRQNCQDHPRHPASPQRFSYSEVRPLRLGTFEFSRTTSPKRKDSPTTHPDGPSLPIPHRHPPPGVSGVLSRSPRRYPGTPVVVSTREPYQRTTPRSVSPTVDHLHRRDTSKLGRPRPERSTVVWSMDPSRGLPLHQPTRATCRDASTATSTSVMVGQESPGGHRQHHDSGVYQPPGWDQVHAPTGPVLRPLQAPRTERHHASSQTHPWSPQQAGRPPEPQGLSGQHRVDPLPQCDQPDLGSMGSSDDRPHGYSSEQQAPDLRQPVSPRSSLRHRRNVVHLAGNGRISISTMVNDSLSPRQATDRERLHPHPDRPEVAQATLVASSRRSPLRRSTRTTASTRPSDDAHLQSTPSESGHTPSARLQSVLESLSNQGFSREVSSRLAKGYQRRPTLKIYESKWKIFSLWCKSRNIDPVFASVSQVADFLLHRFDDVGNGPSACKGYRSAINSVWAFQGRSLNDSFQITALLKGFEADRPRPRHELPKWDLSLVLRALTLPPYEPLAEASPLHLTLKAVFLLLLASARRVGDIHAIDPRRTVVSPTAMILQPKAGYIPKSASTAEGQDRYSPIVVRRLSNLASEPEDMKLCPVRTLLAYDNYAKRLKKRRKCFFLPLKATHKRVKKQTISSWAVK